MIPLYTSEIQPGKNEDKEKISSVYEKYYSVMAYTAGKYLDSSYDVEDVVHDSMMKFIDSMDFIDIDDEKRVKNLLVVIAKNKALNFLKSSENQVLPSEEVALADSEFLGDPCDIAISHDTYDNILKGINSLDEEYKDICILKYVSGLSDKEIARVLDMTQNNVKFKLCKAKRMLRGALIKEDIHV